MREYYDIRVWRMHNDGEITLDEARALIQKHREKLDKRRMYARGDKISSLGELLEQKWVMWGCRTVHIEFIKSLQLRFVIDCLNRGYFYKAMKKSK